MSLKGIIISGVVVVAAVFIIKKQAGSITTLKDSLKSSVHLSGQRKDSITTLTVSNASFSTKNATLTVRLNKSESDAILKVSQLKENNTKLVAVNSTLSAKVAKLKADELVGGVGSVNTTERDSVANRQFATLKAEIKELEATYADLVKAISILKDEKSELENNLNGSNSKLIELENKRLNTISLINQREEEAKGLFSKKRRRILGEVRESLK